MSNTSNSPKGESKVCTVPVKTVLSGAEAIIAHYASCDLYDISHSDDLNEIGEIASKFVSTCPQALRLSSQFVDTLADHFATIAFRCDESDTANDGVSDFDLMTHVEIATQDARALIATSDYMTTKELK